MSGASLIYMVLVLGLVWGGFAYCLFLLATGRDRKVGGSGPTDERRIEQ